jgi:hypothetical protein
MEAYNRQGQCSDGLMRTSEKFHTTLSVVIHDLNDSKA